MKEKTDKYIVPEEEVERVKGTSISASMPTQSAPTSLLEGFRQKRIGKAQEQYNKNILTAVEINANLADLYESEMHRANAEANFFDNREENIAHDKKLREDERTVEALESEARVKKAQRKVERENNKLRKTIEDAYED